MRGECGGGVSELPLQGLSYLLQLHGQILKFRREGECEAALLQLRLEVPHAQPVGQRHEHLQCLRGKMSGSLPRCQRPRRHSCPASAHCSERRDAASRARASRCCPLQRNLRLERIGMAFTPRTPPPPTIPTLHLSTPPPPKPRRHTNPTPTLQLSHPPDPTPDATPDATPDDTPTPRPCHLTTAPTPSQSRLHLADRDQTRGERDDHAPPVVATCEDNLAPLLKLLGATRHVL